MYPTQNMYNTTPNPSVGAVNIQIFNPTAGQAQPTPVYPQMNNYNPAYYPPANWVNTPQQNPTPATNLEKTPEEPIKAKEIDKDDSSTKKEADKTDDKKKDPVPLTDDLIKTYENYLNNQNSQVRLMGAKEILKRFKEDETRKEDPALTPLLNKALQDPASNVRLMAMTSLSTGYAVGNDETIQILKKIQASDAAYNEDAIMATDILAKLAAYDASKLNKTSEPIDTQKK
ncbi:MAG: HEAT repeat domain-containing protein [Candidatus Gastranaerophilales bacterium]|nr:HEAT repeat domain-containing protein [Candidatus Gastranaerophilales bacterium]